VHLLLKKHLPPALLILVLFGLAISVCDTAELKVRFESNSDNFFQVFFGNRAGVYSEADSIKIRVKKGMNTFSIPARNTLLFKQLRIDLMQGTGDAAPPPIILHDISYTYKFLFKDISFNELRNSIQTVQGVASNLRGAELPAEIRFNHADPLLDIKIESRPIFSQILLPAIIFLLIHFFITTILFRSDFRKFRVTILIKGDQNILIEEFLRQLMECPSFLNMIRTKAVGGDVEIHFNCQKKSLPALFHTLSLLKQKYRFDQLHITARQGGVIA